MKHKYRLIALAILPISTFLLLFAVTHSGAQEDRVTILGPGEDDAAKKKAQPLLTEPVPAQTMPAVPSASLPIGTVVAWLKGQAGTPPLPAEWAECNGQVLNKSGSPYHGSSLPDLNGSGRFLRGAAKSGGNGGAELHSHGRFLTNRSGKRQVNVSSQNAANHLPPYYEVVWILKVL